MSDKLRFRRGFVVGIITAVAGAVVTAFGGWLDDLWKLLRSASQAAYGTLISRVSVPIWLLIFAGLVLLALLQATFRSRAPETVLARRPAKPIELDRVQQKILSVLRREDGRAVRMDRMAELIGETNLHTVQGIQSLIGEDLVTIRTSYVDPAEVYLTSAGISFVLRRESGP